MKKIIPLLIALLVSFHINAQEDITLSGLVVEQNSKFNTGKVNYLKNAEIKSVGATPRLSDVNGKFTLIFTDKPFGKTVRVYAEKNGYELVNREELNATAVIGRKTPLKIVFCKQGQLFENQVTYYNIAKDAAIASYEKQIAILEGEGEEKNQLIKQLETQFNQKITNKYQANQLLKKQLETTKQQAKDLADKWVTTNLDDQSETYQRAFRAFLAKDIDKALMILDSVDLAQRLESITIENKKDSALIQEKLVNIEKRFSQVKTDIDQYLFKARLHTHKRDFSETIKLYENILPVVRQLAEQYPESFSSELGRVLNDFGQFLVDKNATKARTYLEESLSIYRKLANNEPHKYNINVCKIAINLGMLYKTELEKTSDIKLKSIGIDLVRDAQNRLPADSVNDESIIQQRSLDVLYNFFSNL